MAFEKLNSFTKDVSDLSDKPSLNPSELKAQFDAAPDEVRQYLNKLIDALKKTTVGDSGAKNIGVSPISGVTGNDIQTVLGNLTTISGSNANGNYVKLPDGTLIQWFNVTYLANAITWSTAAQVGSTYYYTATNWDFPIPFSGSAPISVLASGDIPTFGIEQHKAYNPTILNCRTEQGVLGINPTSMGAITCYKSLLAIGRWK
jgi:hypothetical protein